MKEHAKLKIANLPIRTEQFGFDNIKNSSWVFFLLFSANDCCSKGLSFWHVKKSQMQQAPDISGPALSDHEVGGRHSL
jgi:hypothetical protein